MDLTNLSNLCPEVVDPNATVPDWYIKRQEELLLYHIKNNPTFIYYVRNGGKEAEEIISPYKEGLSEEGRQELDKYIAELTAMRTTPITLPRTNMSCSYDESKRALYEALIDANLTMLREKHGPLRALDKKIVQEHCVSMSNSLAASFWFGFSHGEEVDRDNQERAIQAGFFDD